MNICHSLDPRQMDGLLVLHKPTGTSSTACINRIKQTLGQIKIGHAGTLDPLAEGVLLVLLGQGTKIAPYLTNGWKVYSGAMQLGITSNTYDIEGDIVAEAPINVSRREVCKAIRSWAGLMRQEVPAYSAAKYKGKPLYLLARANKEVPVKTKLITVFHAEPLEITLPVARFRVKCSTGTYVRSLVHSLGKRLGCGATLTQLTREISPPFGLEEAHNLEAVLCEPERFAQRIVPLIEALPQWTRIRLSESLTDLVKNGTWLQLSETGRDQTKAGDRAVFLTPERLPLALVEAQVKGEQLCWAILRGLWGKEVPDRKNDLSPAS